MLGNAEYSRTYGAPANHVRGEFFMDTVKDVRASLDAGRDIFTERERVRIIIPGMIASVLVKDVTEEHRERWPEQYRAFSSGRDPVLSGTPLEEWPVLNKAQVAELLHLQIRTVEELAGLSDIAVQHVGMGGRTLRERAQGWLDEAQHEAFTNKVLHENDVLRSEVATLRTQVEELSRHLTNLSARVAERDDRMGGVATLIPGQFDPVELAKARLPGLPGAQPVPTRSALDAVAARPMRPPRGRHRQDPETETAPDGAVSAGEGAAA
jgi:hypothetical protein